ncbi:MAG: hypothetical protein ACREP8_04940, partial [Candidatus Binatia bacterium]
MANDLVLYGSGYPDSVKLIHRINRDQLRWNLLGFVDDLDEKQGTSVLGYPVLGKGDRIPRFDLDSTYFVNNVFSSPANRRLVTEKMSGLGCRFASLVHPEVNTEFVEIGTDCVIQEGVHFGANVLLGDHTALRMGAVIGHDCQIGPNVFVGQGARVAGFVSLFEDLRQPSILKKDAVHA